MHMCISKRTIIGWDNYLSPGRFQAIIRTNARKLFIRTLARNLSEVLSEIDTFFSQDNAFVDVVWRQFCLGLNVLTTNKSHGMNCTCCESCNTSRATVASDSSLNIHKHDTFMPPQSHMSQIFSPSYSSLKSTYPPVLRYCQFDMQFCGLYRLLNTFNMPCQYIKDSWMI